MFVFATPYRWQSGAMCAMFSGAHSSRFESMTKIVRFCMMSSICESAFSTSAMGVSSGSKRQTAFCPMRCAMAPCEKMALGCVALRAFLAMTMFVLLVRAWAARGITCCESTLSKYRTPSSQAVSPSRRGRVGAWGVCRMASWRARSRS